MEGARRFLLLLVPLVAGCHGAVDAPYPTYAPAPIPYVPASGGANAYDAYVLAAGEAEAAVAPFRVSPLGRTFFTPQQRKDLLKALAPALGRVAAAQTPCDFRYVPTRLGTPPSGRSAWRLIGRALRWQIDDALAAASPEAAVARATIAFRFGNDLCGGGPADRTLGVEIANDAREAILPALVKLDPAGLHRLAQGVKSGLLRRPPVEKSLADADADASLALQTLQDAYRSGDYGTFKALMGRSFRDLEGLRDLKGEKRARFFSDLDAQRARALAFWDSAAALPTAQRAELVEPKPAGDKAQKAFVRHFLLVGKSLLSIEDRSVARLRLLILEAELRRVVALKRRAPESLARATRPWATDPFNGRTFGYQADGAEFRVYSVGANLKDDLGDTDAAGLDPDIRTVLR